MKKLINKFNNEQELKAYLVEIKEKVSSIFKAKIEKELVIMEQWEKDIEDYIIPSIPALETSELILIPASNPESKICACDYFEKKIYGLESTIEILKERAKEVYQETKLKKRDISLYYKNEMEQQLAVKDLEIETLKSNIVALKEAVEFLTNQSKETIKKAVKPTSKELKKPSKLDNETLLKKFKKLKTECYLNIGEPTDLKSYEFIGTLTKENMLQVFEANNFTTKKQSLQLESVIIGKTITASDSYRLYHATIEGLSKEVGLHCDIIKAFKTDYNKFGGTVEFYKNETSTIMKYSNREFIFHKMHDRFLNFNEILEKTIANSDKTFTLDIEDLKIAALNKVKPSILIDVCLLNPNQLIDAIKVSNLKMKYSNKSNAVLFEQDNKKILVMPIYYKD
ncbi:MAG: hypothetical protein ACRC6E_10405 [Fusobacteriaceae bacterium]